MKTTYSYILRPSVGLIAVISLATFPLLHGCAGIRTFPSMARAGDTVTMMVGGSEKASTATVDVTVTADATGQVWDLQALGLVRSVFNVRPDGTAYGLHYASYIDRYISWAFGHEPVQTVLVTDLPPDLPAGMATVDVNLNVTDNSGGATVLALPLEVIPGVGSPEPFGYQTAWGTQAADLTAVEPAPRAKISFGWGNGTPVGAASLVVDFDETVVDPAHLNVYVPESTVSGSWSTLGPFGATQRMAYWHQDGQQLYVDIVAPQGIDPRYLKLYVVHPRNVVGDPALTLVSATVWDVDGNEILLPGKPSLEYLP